MRVVDVEKRLRRRDSRAKRTRVYIFLKNETVLEHLFEGRHNRPQKAWRTLLPEILKQAELGQGFDGMDAYAEGASWSQRAGCSCPCSPGFILLHTGAWDVFVVVDMSEEQVAA